MSENSAILPLYSIHGYREDFYKVVAWKRSPNSWLFSPKEHEHYEEKLRSSFSRARSMVLQYGLCNEWDYFFTGTLDEQKFGSRFDVERYVAYFPQAEFYSFLNALQTSSFTTDSPYYFWSAQIEDSDLVGIRVCDRANNAVIGYLADGDYHAIVRDDTVDEGDPIPANTWSPYSSRKGNLEGSSGIVRMKSYEDLYNLAQDEGGQIGANKRYYYIYKTFYSSSGGYGEPSVLCTPDGIPYVATLKDTSAVDTGRKDTEIIEKDENGETIGSDDSTGSDNSAGIDLGNGTFSILNGLSFDFSDVTYDNTSQTYYVNNSTYYVDNSTNYTYYNFFYQYHINYTSITYIGQTMEYNKYYEVYYELPDGRSSADLTAEELEQLNLSVDVINYGRSTDNTSVRSLYHFDGDTHDSSYWNYCTDFTWNKGASLTYMDAGVFEGALFLDETEHDFTITLPSGLGTGDFTLQWRYYQSATAAPSVDSYVSFAGAQLLKFSGGAFLNSAGLQLAVTPVGTWNELALIRHSGRLYYYLNGLKLGSVVCGLSSSSFTFHFGSSQQTYKYFDELRVLNFALAEGGANYEPSSVPHDTNLTLVLPDSVLPVADEYWSWDTTITPLRAWDFSSGSAEAFVEDQSVRYINYSNLDCSFYFNTADSSLSSDGLSVTLGASSLSSPTDGNAFSYASGFKIPCFYGYYLRMDRESYSQDFIRDTCADDDVSSSEVVTLSLVDREGNVYSCTASTRIVASGRPPYLLSTETFDWGTIDFYYEFYAVGEDEDEEDYELWYYAIQPDVGLSIDIVYAEIVAGNAANTGHEYVSGVTAIDRENLNTPTLAVRSDIDVSCYQIGGVRPSVPTKGQVWALVESGYITSLQIYNGRAWEACDGRIWTGERWVPYRSYNIITLKDMYDIVDSPTGSDYEYIYTESGFWDWWQRSWNSFVELFKKQGSGSGKIDLDEYEQGAASPSPAPEWSYAGSGDLTISGTVKKGSSGLWSLLKSMVGVFGDIFGNVGKAAQTISDTFSTTSENSAYGFFLIPLEPAGEEGET